MDLYDIRRNVYLFSDIGYIPNYYLLDELSRKILNSKDFWINKFNNDGITLFNDNNKTFIEWIDEYLNIHNIQNNAGKIMMINNIEKLRHKNDGLDEINIFQHDGIELPKNIHMIYEIFDTSNIFKDKINNFIEHADYSVIYLKLQLLDNKSYNISYCMCDVYDDTKNVKVTFPNEYDYSQIYNILIKAMYNKLTINDYHKQDFFMLNHEINADGSSSDDNSRIIMLDIVKHLNMKNILFDLNKNDARTIMLIVDIERKYTFKNTILSINVKNNDLLKLGHIFNEIYEKIYKFHHPKNFNITKISIDYLNSRYTCNIHIKFASTTLENIIEVIECDHNVIHNLLMNAINNNINILDNNGHIININYNYDEYIDDYINEYGGMDDIYHNVLRRVVICETLKYLNY